MQYPVDIHGSDTPSAKFRFFVYDPCNGEFEYFDCAEARDEHAELVISSFLDDGWDEDVERVVAGELTHTCEQVGREDRPAEIVLDESGCDAEGKHWGEWEYTCGYALIPLGVPGAESHAAALKTLANLGYTYEGGELWRPALGKKPDFDLLDAKAEEVAQLRAEVERLTARNAIDLAPHGVPGSSYQACNAKALEGDL